MAGGGLQQDEEVLAVGGDAHSLESLVVLATLCGVDGAGVLVAVVDWRIIRREAEDASVSGV